MTFAILILGIQPKPPENVTQLYKIFKNMSKKISPTRKQKKSNKFPPMHSNYSCSHPKLFQKLFIIVNIKVNKKFIEYIKVDMNKNKIINLFFIYL